MHWSGTGQQRRQRRSAAVGMAVVWAQYIGQCNQGRLASLAYGWCARGYFCCRPIQRRNVAMDFGSFTCGFDNMRSGQVYVSRMVIYLDYRVACGCWNGMYRLLVGRTPPSRAAALCRRWLSVSSRSAGAGLSSPGCGHRGQGEATLCRSIPPLPLSPLPPAADRPCRPVRAAAAATAGSTRTHAPTLAPPAVG